MNTLFFSIRRALCTLCALPAMAIAAPSAHLNIYNWSDYIAPNTISQFEKKEGIAVRYDVYDRDDTLHAKLLTGHSGYDIVVPTGNYAGREIMADMFLPLDRSQLPNLKYLDPEWMRLVEAIDPGNRYVVPWAYGTTGLAYNVTKVQEILGKDVQLDRWDILFDPKYVSQLKRYGVSMLDAPDQVFATVLHYLGKDPNSINPADYRLALQTLKKIRPYITQFNSSGYINDMAGGDICMAFGWSGDMAIARRRAEEAKKPYRIQYFIPQGGAAVWFDVMAIPKDAPHPKEALKWINYIETPEVHAAITNHVFYPNANIEAKRYVRPDILKDPGIYPPPEVMKTLFPLKPLPLNIVRLQTRLWQEFKTGH